MISESWENRESEKCSDSGYYLSLGQVAKIETDQEEWNLITGRTLETGHLVYSGHYLALDRVEVCQVECDLVTGHLEESGSYQSLGQVEKKKEKGQEELETGLIDSGHYLTTYLSRSLTSLQVEVEALCPGFDIPTDVFEAGLTLFDRFAVLGSTWPFVVFLRETQDRVFMFNSGGLTRMLLTGLLDHKEEAGPRMSRVLRGRQRSVEMAGVAGGPGGDSPTLVLEDTPEEKRQKAGGSQVRRAILRFLHFNWRLHVFRKSRKCRR